MSKKIQHIAFALIGLLLINYLSTSTYKRFDLTKDKRYTIPVGENVHLEIMPTGLKSWRMRYLKPEE